MGETHNRAISDPLSYPSLTAVPLVLVVNPVFVRVARVPRQPVTQILSFKPPTPPASALRSPPMSLPTPHRWLPIGGGGCFLIPTITILTCAPFSSSMLDNFTDRAFLARVCGMPGASISTEAAPRRVKLSCPRLRGGTGTSCADAGPYRRGGDKCVYGARERRAVIIAGGWIGGVKRRCLK